MGLFTARLSKLNNQFTDSERFVGIFEWENWKQITGLNDTNSEDYIPDSTIIEELKAKLHNTNFSFIFFVAEWCGDSRYAVPIVMELLKLAGINENRIILVGVSRDKMSPDMAFRNSIDSIPTLLVQSNEYEIGRIEEEPAVSWEYDLLKILSDF